MGRLVRRPDGSFTLDGKPVEAGSHLELRLPRLRWLPGRFELASPPPRPTLRILLGGTWEQGRGAARTTAALELAAEADVRWRDPAHRPSEPPLPAPAKAILAALIGGHPSRYTRPELARMVGLLDESAVFESSLRMLRNARLVIADGGFLVANPELFRSLGTD